MPTNVLEANAKDNKKTQETRAERFKRVVERRANALLEKIRVLGNCADKRTYEYSQENIEVLFSTLEKELKRIKMKFFVESRSKNKFGFPKET